MTDALRFLGTGWSYPVEVDPRDGSIRLAPSLADIKQAVEIIIRTELGERVMRPDFGAGMHAKVFDSLGSVTLGRYRAAITDALRRYEPRIEEVEVDVAVTDPLDGRVVITVSWLVRRTNRRDNLVYEFYLQRGG